MVNWAAVLTKDVRVSALATAFGEDWARETYGADWETSRCYGTFTRWQNKGDLANLYRNFPRDSRADEE